MTQSRSDIVRSLPHRHEPRALHFPESAETPETMVHLLVRTFLFQLLLRTLRGRGAIGSEQFVYFNASDPQRCLAPDVFVKLGVEQTLFPTWKTWERGAPDLAVEIASESDTRVWGKKLDDYREMGVHELVRFDPEAPAGERLRAWDRIDEDLVERVVQGDRTPCVLLGSHWVVAPAAPFDAVLRLAHDRDGNDLLLTIDETQALAEKRIAELEAELRRRGG